MFLPQFNFFDTLLTFSSAPHQIITNLEEGNMKWFLRRLHTWQLLNQGLCISLYDMKDIHSFSRSATVQLLSWSYCQLVLPCLLF